MRLANASIVWRRQGREISSSSRPRCLLLDFQWPVSLSSLSEELLEDGLLLLRLSRRLSSESLRGGVLFFLRVRRLSLELELEGLLLGEYLSSLGLSCIRRSPILSWTLRRRLLVSLPEGYCLSSGSSSPTRSPILLNTGGRRVVLSLRSLLGGWYVSSSEPYLRRD